MIGQLNWRNYCGSCSEDDDDDDDKNNGFGGEVHLKKAQKDATEPFRRCQTESKKPNLSLKAELLSLTEHLQRNPTYEKGEGRPLPARGAPLTKLTTIKLSRKKKSGVFRPKVCGKYALQGSSRALFTPFDLTHKECT